MKVGYFEQYQETPIQQRPDQVDTPLAGMTDQELLSQLLGDSTRTYKTVRSSNQIKESNL